MSLEKEVREIKERNKRVELDKAWETSATRRCLIALLTYLVIVVFFSSARLEKPWLNAIIPAAAFLLSTLSFTFVKKRWLKRKTRP